MARKKQVYVLGMNEKNRERLDALPIAERVDFRTLLSYEESHGARQYRIEDIYERARQRLTETDGSIDGIIGFWDFPVSTILPLLCEEFDLPGPTLESVLRCEHKYWSRLVQKEAAPEVTPGFEAVDPYDDSGPKIDLPFPYWIKPVKSFAGHLGFRIDSSVDLERALKRIRDGLPRFSEPFQWVLDRADLPPEIAERGAALCVAEEIIGGWQCTVEGVVLNGDVHVHGVVDSLPVEGMSIFDRYIYPSRLPEKVKERMFDATRRIMKRIDYDNRAFNIEFFWDENTDEIALLEINARISQSHSFLFQKVDGVSNHAVVVGAALGEDPDWPLNEGPFEVAGKFFTRCYSEDGVVKRVPHDDDLARMREIAPEAEIEIAVDEGDRLSDLLYQDSYSFKLAVMYLADADRDALLAKRARVEVELPFDVEEHS